LCAKSLIFTVYSEKNIADENILYENTAEEIKNHNARLIYVTPQGSVYSVLKLCL